MDCEDDPHWRRELVSEARRGEAPGDSGGRAAGPLTGMIDGVGGALLTQLLTGEEMRGAWEQGAKVVTYGSIGGKVAALEDVVARAGCVLVKEGASSVLGGKSTGSLQGRLVWGVCAGIGSSTKVSYWFCPGIEVLPDIISLTRSNEPDTNTHSRTNQPASGESERYASFPLKLPLYSGTYW